MPETTETLPGKYSKLLLFGVWLLSNISMSDDKRKECFDRIKLYDNVDDQTAFYEEFYRNRTQLAKSCNKMISVYNTSQKKANAETSDNDIPLGRDELLRNTFITKLIEKLQGAKNANI